MDLGWVQIAGGQPDAGAAAHATRLAEGVGDRLVRVDDDVGMVVGSVVEGVGDGRVLHPGTQIVHQGSHLGEATPVGVNQDRHEGHEGEDDQDSQEGVGGALRVAAAPHVRFRKRGDPTSGVGLWDPLVARKLVISVNLRSCGLNPLDKWYEVAVALPWVIV